MKLLSSSRLWFWLGLSALLGCRAAPAPAPAPTRSSVSFSIPLLHAHNDYLHSRPLLDALELGFESVEVDVFLEGETLRVGHNRTELKGTLEALYLDPLQARARAGTVLPQGRPFYLWIDLKEDSPKLRTLLRNTLDRFPMLARFDGTALGGGAVVAILTGNAGAKTALGRGPRPLPFVRDSNDLPDSTASTEEDAAFRYYALNWGRTLRWDGKGEPPTGLEENLRALMQQAHAQGRAVRFWNAPHSAEAWTLAALAGVDFLQADDLAALARWRTDFVAHESSEKAGPRPGVE